jgi:hypothetical protein
LNYPVSNSLDEWAGEIHTLDKLVVEGLKYNYLKNLCQKLGCHKPDLGSIKLLKAILEARHIDPHEINEIVTPLAEMHDLRTKFSGHKRGKETAEIRKQIVSQHGTLKNHYRSLIERTAKAIKEIILLTSQGYL